MEATATAIFVLVSYQPVVMSDVRKLCTGDSFGPKIIAVEGWRGVGAAISGTRGAAVMAHRDGRVASGWRGAVKAATVPRKRIMGMIACVGGDGEMVQSPSQVNSA